MKRVFYAACVLSAVVFAACTKTEDSTTPLNATDQTFELQSTVSNTAEINAGTLAATKATNPRVRSFAQFMVTEHTMAETDLKALGTSTGVAVKDSVDPGHQALMAQLMALPPGRGFDSAYMYTQVSDHDATIATFQNEINNGQHPGVKQYANTYLPHIQMHRQMADSISTAYFKR